MLIVILYYRYTSIISFRRTDDIAPSSLMASPGCETYKRNSFGGKIDEHSRIDGRMSSFVDWTMKPTASSTLHDYYNGATKRDYSSHIVPGKLQRNLCNNILVVSSVYTMVACRWKYYYDVLFCTHHNNIIILYCALRLCRQINGRQPYKYNKIVLGWWRYTHIHTHARTNY